MVGSANRWALTHGVHLYLGYNIVWVGCRQQTIILKGKMNGCQSCIGLTPCYKVAMNQEFSFSSSAAPLFLLCCFFSCSRCLITWCHCDAMRRNSTTDSPACIQNFLICLHLVAKESGKRIFILNIHLFSCQVFLPIEKAIKERIFVK